MTSTVADQLIIANLIAARRATSPNLDVLTFVEVGPQAEFIDQIRTYDDLWANGQRVAASLDEVIRARLLPGPETLIDLRP